MLSAVIDIGLREAARGNRDALRVILRDLLGHRAQPLRDWRAHMEAAVAWLMRAQDATRSGGVAHGYLVAWHRGYRARGWLPAYPETTGYIIPTMFDYAAATGDANSRRRALAMADWEIEVQMPSGAVRGGMIAGPATPAVFNTGQVIFGWLRAAQETGDARYLEAAEGAGRFLVDQQDSDGVWRRGLSQYAQPGVQTYNTRTAWALLELARATGNPIFRNAGIRNIESALGRQLPNGWFTGTSLDSNDAPLTHAIAYAVRGILEAGCLVGDERYLAAAQRAADALRAMQRPDGSLAGRYDCRWRPAVRWSCLTGNAQVAIVWLRLGRMLNEPRYLSAAARSLSFLANCQDLRVVNEGIRGGIAGSFPIFASYAPFEYPSWAAKFFVEALLTPPAAAFARPKPQPTHLQDGFPRPAASGADSGVLTQQRMLPDSGPR